MTQQQLAQQQIILTTAHREYERGLHLYAFSKLHNRAVGEDLVQDTFMKTWNYLVKGGQIETMKAFLYHVLNNLIVDQYRKHKATSLDVLLEKGFTEPSTDHPARLESALDGEAALAMIEELPKKYRRVLHLRYVDDLSLKEISAITKQSKNTIAVQLHRGLEKLKMLQKDTVQV